MDLSKKPNQKKRGIPPFYHWIYFFLLFAGQLLLVFSLHFSPPGFGGGGTHEYAEKSGKTRTRQQQRRCAILARATRSRLADPKCMGRVCHLVDCQMYDDGRNGAERWIEKNNTILWVFVSFVKKKE